jgi:hypothetical protein
VTQHGTSGSVFAARPQLAAIDHVSHSDNTKLYYDPALLIPAWKYLIDSIDDIEGEIY